MSDRPRVALVIPAFNEAKRLPSYILAFSSCLTSSQALAVDVIVADDGSSPSERDSVAATLSQISFPPPHSIQLRSFPTNRGKGAVLRDCFLDLTQSHPFVAFCDADGATPATEVLRLLERLASEATLDAIIGSRWKALGHPVDRTLRRHLSGRIFATLLSNLFDIPVYDSQCGAKAYRSSALSKDLIESCQDNAWLFDTQLLLVLLRSGRRVVEEPVEWHDVPGSKVSLLKDSLRMGFGLLRERLKFH